MVETVTGAARSAGVSYDDVLASDSHPVSDIMKVDSPIEMLSLAPTRVKMRSTIPMRAFWAGT